MYKTKGIITAIGEVKNKRSGKLIQTIWFEDEYGNIFTPVLKGKKVALLKENLAGDVVEIEFCIKRNNQIIITNLVRV